MNFPVIIHKDKDSDYGVIIPDLPGCFSAGDSYEDALANTCEAIECHIEGLLEDGEPVPQAMSIEQHKSNEFAQDAVFALVSADSIKMIEMEIGMSLGIPFITGFGAVNRFAPIVHLRWHCVERSV